MHVGESVPAANNSDQVEASSSESKPEQKLGNLSANIIPHLFKLYDCTATAADYEIYAPKAVFEDPLMQAHGIRYLIHLMLSVWCETYKIFKEAQIVDYTITEEETAPGSGDWTTPCRLKLPHHLCKLHILVACFKDYAIRTIKSRELFFTNLPFIFQSTTKVVTNSMPGIRIH
ncbi:hypothetical protein CY35_04G123000 [Sphagnum magellanicum]|nr:hypothetical protein CY35_04G123000 [Sphagnum magellanicum]